MRENFFQTYSVRRVEMSENKNMYVTVSFAGVALMVALLIGVVVMRRRNTRYPHHQVEYLIYPPLSLSLSLSLSYLIFLLSSNTNTAVHCSEIFIKLYFLSNECQVKLKHCGFTLQQMTPFLNNQLNSTQTLID